MRIAIDKDGNRVHINNANAKEEYFCPICGEKLVQKKGDIRIHHYSHIGGGESQCDKWHYEMGFWHEQWQNKFPENTREVVFENDGEKHRTDICLEDQKIVIEFQHSNITAEEFDNRNNFYNKLGFKVVWLFDVEDAFKNEEITETRKINCFIWKKYRKNFSHYDINNPQIEIYFEFEHKYTEDEYFEDFENTEDYQGYIGKLSWISDSGINCFAIKDNTLTSDEFYKLLIGENKDKKELKKITIADLYDQLIEYRSLNQGIYIYGCGPEIDLDDCMPCQYCIGAEDEPSLCCVKNFRSLNIPRTTEVWDVKRKYGYITSFRYKYNGKEEQYIKNYDFEILDSIPNLWKKYHCIVGIFKNIRTNKTVKINRDPIKYIEKYNRCYGHFLISGYNYYRESKEIFNAFNKEWVCIWFKDQMADDYFY